MSAKDELNRRLDKLGEKYKRLDPERRPKMVVIRVVDGDGTDVDAEAARQLGRPLRDDDVVLVLRRVASGTERGMVG